MDKVLEMERLYPGSTIADGEVHRDEELTDKNDNTVETDYRELECPESKISQRSMLERTISIIGDDNTREPGIITLSLEEFRSGFENLATIKCEGLVRMAKALSDANKKLDELRVTYDVEEQREKKNIILGQIKSLNSYIIKLLEIYKDFWDVGNAHLS